MNKLLPCLFGLFGWMAFLPRATAQCGYSATVRTNKDYCLGSSLVVNTSHLLKKIVWFKNGQPVDSALARESLDLPIRITLDGAAVDGDLVSDESGNIYTFDFAHHRIVRWTPGTGTGVATVGSYPWEETDWNTLFVDHQGNVYATNSDQQAVLKYIPGDTVGIPVIKVSSSQRGFGAGLYVDCQGTIYVCNDQQTVTKWPLGASSGMVVIREGALTSTGLGGPIRVDSMGNIFALWFGGLTKWAPGDTSGAFVSSWTIPDISIGMWIGGDDSVLILSAGPTRITINEAGPGVYTVQILGDFPYPNGEGGHASVTMDPKGNVYAMDDDDPYIYELQRHSSIDSGFTPQDTGVYYAIATDMQGYSVMTNKIVINSPLSGLPSIAIMATATSTPVCTPITFTAATANTGIDPVYQWQVSGVPVGGDSTGYSYNLFANGDQVYCIMTAQAGCTGPVTDTSNVITLTIDPHGTASVSISTPRP